MTGEQNVHVSELGFMSPLPKEGLQSSCLPKGAEREQDPPWGRGKGSAGESFSIGPLLFALCYWALPHEHSVVTLG